MNPQLRSLIYGSLKSTESLDHRYNPDIAPHADSASPEFLSVQASPEALSRSPSSAGVEVSVIVTAVVLLLHLFFTVIISLLLINHVTM